MTTYTNHWLRLKIVGFIEEDGCYEVYHAQNKNPKRDIILHLLKNGTERRFNVKPAKQFKVEAQGPSATREKAVTPWVGDGNKTGTD